MAEFTCEEQGTKKYLIYRKKEEDKQDIISREMMSNNRIEGIVPFDSIQIDESIYMKYDITGLVSLQEYLSGIVKQAKLLSILESMIDAFMVAEDYMLELSEYVLDKSYIYVNPSTKKLSMIVLPVLREGTAVDVFLRDLIFSIQYDQNENCSHVAAFVGFFQSMEYFSIQEFRSLVNQLKEKCIDRKENGVKTETEKVVTYKPEVSKAGLTEKSESVPVYKKNPSFDKSMMEPLYSNSLSFEPGLGIQEKEKKGFFRRKEKEEKSDKQEKKIFFGKRVERKKKENDDTDNGVKNILGNIAIPGMGEQELGYGEKQSENRKAEDVKNDYQRQNVVIPVQNIAMQQYEVDPQDFGGTVYLNNSAQGTIQLNQKEVIRQPKFVLYRCSTKESFEIIDEITRIGRNPNITEICISGNRSVGRIHAVLHVHDMQVYIEDNGSKNGTFVDGEEIRQGTGKNLLIHGSKIRLGDEELEFHVY